MAPILTILASATLAIAVQVQEFEKVEPVPKRSTQTEKPKPAKKKLSVAKVKGEQKVDFDVNFRAQEARTRMAINTLGGKLVPVGKKPGEGC